MTARRLPVTARAAGRGIMANRLAGMEWWTGLSPMRTKTERCARPSRAISIFPAMRVGRTFGGTSVSLVVKAWDATIAAAIQRAEVFLLLVTPEFFASRYIRDVERPAIEARKVQCDGLVVSVILRMCLWEHKVAGLQALPVGNLGRVRAIGNWHPQNDGYHAANEQLLRAIKYHRNNRRGGKP